MQSLFLLIMPTILDFDELNTLTEASVSLSDSVEEVVDKVETLLILAYQKGFDAVEEMLECDIAYNTASMQEVIYRKIEGKTFADRVRDHIENNDLTGLQNLVANEAHRVAAAAGHDCATSLSRQGVGVVKVWQTMQDPRVRDTHDYIQDDRVGLDEHFYTYDGDHAPYPGAFGYAENNIGCRCWIIYQRI